MTLDKFRGCLLGQVIGDALGAPFEGMPAEAIYYEFGMARRIVARLGVDSIPPGLLQRLENGVKGRDYIDDLAGRLWRRFASRTAGGRANVPPTAP